MEKPSGGGRRFNGNVWFENQVRFRTRAALTAKGSKAGCRTAEYNQEYQRQLALFRAERAEVKRRKQEKNLARAKKDTPAEKADLS